MKKLLFFVITIFFVFLGVLPSEVRGQGFNPNHCTYEIIDENFQSIVSGRITSNSTDGEVSVNSIPGGTYTFIAYFDPISISSAGNISVDSINGPSARNFRDLGLEAATNLYRVSVDISPYGTGTTFQSSTFQFKFDPNSGDEIPICEEIRIKVVSDTCNFTRITTSPTEVSGELSHSLADGATYYIQSSSSNIASNNDFRYLGSIFPNEFSFTHDLLPNSTVTYTLEVKKHVNLGSRDTVVCTSDPFQILPETTDWNNRIILTEKAFNICKQIPSSQTTERASCCSCLLGSSSSETCADQGVLVIPPGIDPGIWTSVGCIKTSSSGIVGTLLGIGLTVGGGATLLTIIAAGFRMSVSQGDPKKVGEARDMVTAAIIGLLFIIFSVVILQFIGVELIKIPGFGTP